MKRYVSIWFPYLETEWFAIRRPELRQQAFILAAPDYGRMIVTNPNELAQQKGIHTGMTVADARTIINPLLVLDAKPGLNIKLLTHIGEWFIRYTPFVSLDPPAGLLLDASGCAHLWNGENNYLHDIINRLKKLQYTVHVAIADTIGAAWAFAHFGGQVTVVEPGHQSIALLKLPASSLRIDKLVTDRLEKLGLRQIKNFINLPRAVLRRRFGKEFILRLEQALGFAEELIQPLQPVIPYQGRLPSMEPIVTRTGIEIALQQLLDTLCKRLEQEQKGLRAVTFKCYRTDGKTEMLTIGTNRPSFNVNHLFKLFEFKLDQIEPASGIDLFLLEATKVDPVAATPVSIWEKNAGLSDPGLSELLDRIETKLGPNRIHRYLPAEHYWPERSIKVAGSLDEMTITPWNNFRPRPLHLLPVPQLIEVTAPIPDYPPMSFRYKKQFHKIIKAEGPERIEQEWWLQNGEHRDYYYVEDEEGQRYWLFRLGHYTTEKIYQWFIHGIFA